MKRVDENFKQLVYKIVRQIPKGRVMTYGQIAALAGAPWAAWEVGQIAHLAPCADLPACRQSRQPAGLTAHRPSFGSAAPSQYRIRTAPSAARQNKAAAPSARHEEYCPAHDLPWQRVVNKNGGLARGYTPGGYEAHKRDLEKDGIVVSEDYAVDVKELLWWPENPDQSSLPL